MTTLSPVTQADPRVNDLARQVIDTYNQQGGAAAARKLREVTGQQNLTAEQKKAVYEGAEPAVDAMAVDLSKNAQTDFNKTPGTAGGEIDSSAEYDQTMEDLGVVFENTGDTAEAREFGKDVLDGIAAPHPGSPDPLAALGHFGEGLQIGLKKNNTQFLASSVAFSLMDAGSTNTGIYTLDSGQRQATVDKLLKTVDDTPVADGAYVVENGDTMWDVASRKDVQRYVLTPEEMKRAETEHWSKDRTTRFTLDKLEADNGYHRKLDDGHVTSEAGDPDLINTGETLKIVNRSGETLTVQTEATGGQKAPNQSFNFPFNTPATQAQNIATLYARDPGAAVAQYKQATASMPADKKASFDAELLKKSGGRLGADMLNTMGVDASATGLLTQTGYSAGIGKDNQRTNVQALYQVYAAAGGDPAKFVSYVNQVASSGPGALDKACRGAQNVMNHAKNGQPQVDKKNDGVEGHNWSGKSALIDPAPTTPPESISGLREWMDFHHIPGFPPKKA